MAAAGRRAEQEGVGAALIVAPQALAKANLQRQQSRKKVLVRALTARQMIPQVRSGTGRCCKLLLNMKMRQIISCLTPAMILRADLALLMTPSRQPQRRPAVLVNQRRMVRLPCIPRLSDGGGQA